MEKPAAIGNSYNLCQLIKYSSLRKPREGEVIHRQSCRLERWTGQFREEFSWRTDIVGPSVISTGEPMYVGFNPPFKMDLIRGKFPEESYGCWTKWKFSCLLQGWRRNADIGVSETPGIKMGRRKNFKDWYKSMMVVIYRKSNRCLLEDSREISLVNIVSKLLAGIILHRLSGFRKRCMFENQADLHPGHSSIDQISLCDRY